MATVFKLGQKAKDRVTGFEGVITARCTFLTGCDRYSLQPQVLKDGNVIEERWFDVNRLDLVDGEVIELAGAVERAPEGFVPG